MIEILRTVTCADLSQARQSLVSPSIYLDTWAIRELSENLRLGNRFRDALFGAKGTLALSDINMIEFASFDDPSHVRSAGQFVDSFYLTCF
jgi:hypothetical protein